MPKEKRFIIYVDWNVIVEFISNNFRNLHSVLKRHKEANKIFIPFSSEHVEEATKIKLESEEKTRDEIRKRLKYISELSSNLYFVNNMTDTKFCIKHPLEVYNTITEGDLGGFDSYKLFSEMVNYDSLKQYREFFGIYSNELNNMSTSEVIPKLDEILNSNRQENGQQVSIKSLIKEATKISDQEHGKYEYHQIMTRKRTFQINVLIYCIFSLLDSSGFWPDKKATYKKGSRCIDCRHAFNGSFADAVISNDRRFCKKTEAVYEYLQLETKVFYISEDEQNLLEFIKSAI